MRSAHQKIGQALLKFEERQEPALVSELVRLLGYAAESSLTPTLQRMQDTGLLLIRGGGEKGRPRVVVLSAKGRFALGGGGLPLLGSIPAGPLEEAIAEADEVIEPAGLLPSRPGDFLLRVRGNSMTGDGILPGDLVLLRPNVEAGHGEIAAVLVGEAHETTLKRVFWRPDTQEVVLKASNVQYPDRTLSAKDVRIAGVYRGLIRHASA